MEYVDIISRIVHVGTAITVVGGSAFFLFVLMPSARELPDEADQQLSVAIKNRWKRFVHLGVLLFLVSGFYNYLRMIPLHRGDGLYHALVGTKILIALVLFFIASALVGSSEKLEPMRQNRAKWLKVVVLLAALIVAISGYLKVRGTGPVEKVPEPIGQVLNTPAPTRTAQLLFNATPKEAALHESSPTASR